MKFILIKIFIVFFFCSPFLNLFAASERYMFNQELAKLNKLKSLYKGKQIKIKDLMKRRSQVDDSKKQSEIREVLVQLHKELEENYNSYLKLYNEIKYKYPRFSKSMIKQNLRVRSLHEIENELGFNDLLDELKRKVETKYELVVKQHELTDDRDFQIKKLQEERRNLQLVK